MNLCSVAQFWHLAVAYVHAKTDVHYNYFTLSKNPFEFELFAELTLGFKYKPNKNIHLVFVVRSTKYVNFSIVSLRSENMTFMT